MKSEKNYGFLMKAKIQGDKLPVYKGTITIDGTEYELAGWIKKAAKTGEDYLSLSATEKDVDRVKSKPAAKTEDKSNGFLPF